MNKEAFDDELDEKAREELNERVREELDDRIASKKAPYMLALGGALLVAGFDAAVIGGSFLGALCVLVMIGAGGALWAMREESADVAGLTEQRKKQLSFQKMLRDNKEVYKDYIRLCYAIESSANKALEQYADRVSNRIDERYVKLGLKIVMYCKVLLRDQTSLEQQGYSEEQRTELMDVFFSAVTKVYSKELTLMIPQIIYAINHDRISIEAAMMRAIYIDLSSPRSVVERTLAEHVAFLEQFTAEYDL